VKRSTIKLITLCHGQDRGSHDRQQTDSDVLGTNRAVRDMLTPVTRRWQVQRHARGRYRWRALVKESRSIERALLRQHGSALPATEHFLAPRPGPDDTEAWDSSRYGKQSKPPATRTSRRNCHLVMIFSARCHPLMLGPAHILPHKMIKDPITVSGNQVLTWEFLVAGV